MLTNYAVASPNLKQIMHKLPFYTAVKIAVYCIGVLLNDINDLTFLRSIESVAGGKALYIVFQLGIGE